VGFSNAFRGRGGIRRAKWEHEKALAGRIRENPEIFYKYVKGKSITREGVVFIRDQKGAICVEPEDIGRVLNEYFTSVFSCEKEDVGTEFGERDCEDLEQFNIGSEELSEVLVGLKVDESPGPDKLYPRLLWEAREESTGALTQTFNSHREGTFKCLHCRRRPFSPSRVHQPQSHPAPVTHVFTLLIPMTLRGNLPWPINLTRTSSEHPEETHSNMGRMCKFHTNGDPQARN